MWRAPNAQHLVRSGLNHACDEPIVTTGHRVLSIGQHCDQLDAPLVVQCVEKLDNHVEHVFSSVAFEHGDGDQVEVALFMIASTATMSSSLSLSLSSCSSVRKKIIAYDRVDNVSRDDEFDRVCGQVHVLVQSVDALHFALEVLLFVLVRYRLVGSPRLDVLLQMAAIVEGSE
ncbi:unnamed protein product [Sphagnum compactum]